MNIRDVLLPALRARFPSQPFRTADPPDPIAVFTAPDPAIGELSIYDDDTEATVVLGRLTHGHFNPYDLSLTRDEVATCVTELVIGFLDDLFADNTIVWVATDGQSGGWTTLVRAANVADTERRNFVWSGPYRPGHSSPG